MSRVGFTDSHWSLGNSGTSWKLQPRFDETWSLFPDTSKFFLLKKKRKAFTSVLLRVEVRNCAASQMWIPWVVFLNSHRPLDYDGFKNKNTSPPKKIREFFLCFVCFVSTAFQDLGVIFFQPNKNRSRRSFSGACSSPRRLKQSARIGLADAFWWCFLCSCFRRPLSPPKAKESTRKVRFAQKSITPISWLAII